MTKIESIIRKLLYSCYINIFVRDYKLENSIKKGRVLVSYLPTPFYKKGNEKYFSYHQNRRESIIIAKIFHELGYSVTVRHFRKLTVFRKRYDIIFGLEPNFVRESLYNPNALKIYYATGTYYQFQNKLIKERTDQFNKKNNTAVPYYRLVAQHVSAEISDYIFQIGTMNTLLTYPASLRSKIRLLDQSCEDFNNFQVSKKIELLNKNTFIWFGSGGSILKGLDLVIDYFYENHNLKLHIVGPIDKEVYHFYKNKLLYTNNIKYHGFLNIHSIEFQTIVNQSTFLIFPSASEGSPGSVINLKKLGIIPVVSKIAAVDSIKELGVVIEDLTINGIAQAVKEALSYTDEQLIQLIYANISYANTKYNLQQFERKFKAAAKSTLGIGNEE